MESQTLVERVLVLTRKDRSRIQGVAAQKENEGHSKGERSGYRSWSAGPEAGFPSPRARWCGRLGRFNQPTGCFILGASSVQVASGVPKNQIWTLEQVVFVVPPSYQGGSFFVKTFMRDPWTLGQSLASSANCGLASMFGAPAGVFSGVFFSGSR